METRQCKVCSKILPLVEPHYILKKDNRTGKYFYLKTCAECYRAKERERINSKYAIDPDYKAKCNERSKNYILSDEQKTKHKEAVRNRQKANPEKVKRAVRKRQKNNQERMNECSNNWQKNNRDKMNEYYNNYCKTPKGNFIMRCKSRWKSAKKRFNLTEEYNHKDIKPNSFDELRNKQGGKCAVNKKLKLKDEHGNIVYVIDHITPFARGGHHTISNIRLIHPDTDRLLNYRTQ